MKQAYGKARRPTRGTLAFIREINTIIDEYLLQGYVLTVRQLYYQLVARGTIPNNQAEYKRTANIVSEGRLAGLIDWDAIEDRTRAFLTNSRWDSPKQILQSAADGFHMDMWATQPCRVFLIVEKEALQGVFSRMCAQYDVPQLAARGYPSISVVREFAEGPLQDAAINKSAHILHFGDHDPSGIDMSRDLIDRLTLILGHDHFDFTRCALNMDQVREVKPPENPAKSTDSRFGGYAKKFGTSSWELDALPPQYLNNLVKTHVDKLINKKAWKSRLEEIQGHKDSIAKIAANYGKRK